MRVIVVEVVVMIKIMVRIMVIIDQALLLNTIIPFKETILLHNTIITTTFPEPQFLLYIMEPMDVKLNIYKDQVKMRFMS